MEVTAETKTTLEVTPELLAAAFWAMDDNQQADFFEALADEVERTPIVTSRFTYNFGEIQWCYMHDKLKERGGKGLEMYYALSAFAFDFSQMNCGLRQKVA